MSVSMSVTWGLLPFYLIQSLRYGCFPCGGPRPLIRPLLGPWGCVVKDPVSGKGPASAVARLGVELCPCRSSKPFYSFYSGQAARQGQTAGVVDPGPGHRKSRGW